MASSALLAQIQAGTRLKKAQTNDRSAPQLDPSKKTPSGGGGGYAPPVLPSNSNASAGAGIGAGPPQLGALFAGGIPKLKPAQTDNGMCSSF